MTVHVKVGGVWKDVAQASVRVGGVWKDAEVWVRVGGTWKLVSADFTPDAVTWDDISTFGLNGTNINKTISGINTTVTIKIVWDGDASTVRYRKNSGTYTDIASGGTFTVVNGDTVNFRVPDAGVSGNISVLNNSNGDSLIDSFIYG